MTFYLSTPVSDSWENVVFEVYLKEVTATTYASATANTEGTNTVVYTGSLDGSKSTMVVPFSSNYVYGGGNLLVGFKVTTTGYYANTYFSGETFSSGTYPAFHSDGASHNGCDNFLPKVTFEYTAGIGVMKKPKDVTASNISMNSATISWTAGGSETSWEVSYSTSADEPAADGSYTTVNTNSYELTGLTAGTTYYVYVRSVDGDNKSKWSKVYSFTPGVMTINEGTTTNEYVPIYGYYVDAITKSQFVIPASSLQDMQWGNITKMTFYTQESSINWGNAQFEVYMTEQNGTTLSSMTDYATMTKVKSAGSLSVSDGKMVVTLDEPYLYRGDDLVIGFLQTVKGSYVKSHWYGVTADGASFGGYGSTVSQKSFLPKTTFDYELGENLTLAENADNSTVISENNGKLANVTLTRTLKTGGWNTFCAPFSTETPSGWTVKELSSTSFANGTLTLNFADATSIEAGKPYLVKVAATTDLSTAPFTGVIVSKDAQPFTSADVDFIPTLGATTIPDGDTKAVLFLAAGNKLLNPSALPADMKGFRAYFQLKGDAASLARAFSIDFGDGETTGIKAIDNGQLTIDNDRYYDLQGRKVNAAQKGVYIQNGKKVIIK